MSAQLSSTSARNPRKSTNPVKYTGKRTKTGNSTGFRFEQALFKSHPEFSGEVTAQIIAPGRMIVVAEPQQRPGEDPVLTSFLAFLDHDMRKHPERIQPLDQKLIRRIRKLTKGIAPHIDEDLGQDSLLS